MCRLKNDRARREALDKLPPGLFATYEQILDRISIENDNLTCQHIVTRTLKWLMVAKEPLNIAQIAEAIAEIQDENNRYDDAAIPDEDDILSMCSSLIRVNATKQSVEFSHYSVKLFLCDKKLLEKNKYSSFYIELEEEEHMAAVFCLTYLCLQDFELGYVYRLDKYRLYQQKYKFYQYPAVHWEQHIRSCPEQLYSQQINTLLRRFLTPDKSPAFLYWLQCFFLNGESLEGHTNMQRLIDDHVSKDITTLHVAARCGLVEIVDWIIKEPLVDVDSMSDCFGTPLTCALLSSPHRFKLNASQRVDSSMETLNQDFSSRRIRVITALVAAGSNIRLSHQCNHISYPMMR